MTTNHPPRRTTTPVLVVLTLLSSLPSLPARVGTSAPSTPSTATAPGFPYAHWKHGPVSSADDFPIAVWLQDPRNAAKYKAAGFNLYIGLWEGPTEAQFKALAAAGMPVICSQNAVGLAHRDDATIVGWMHGDEPDNAQPVRDANGKRGYGPPVPPGQIVKAYEKIRAADPTRPVMLNLGQGVANDEWKGRGSGARLDDYLTYVKGGDIVSFDIYPVASLGKKGPDSLWLVPKGLDRLAKWSAESAQGERGEAPEAVPPKVLWNCVECTHIEDPSARATPEQVKAEVWMSLIHGSRGLIYFVHQFKPKFDEHALLDDPAMLAAVTAINKQIRKLAPALNSPTVADGVAVHSSSADVPIDAMVKKAGGSTYLFAVGMRNAPSRGTFEVKGLPAAATAEVLGESRTVEVRGGRFEDDFAVYGVHLYRLSGKP